MQLVENRDWVEEKFGQCQFGHVKRTERVKKLATNVLECPEASLRQQNQDWSDLKAAYRLFDRDEVTFDAMAECHWERTRQTPPGRYLLIRDTTEISHYSLWATSGLGPIGNGKGRGMQLHSCLMLNSSSKMVEGIAGALIHYRTRVPKNEARSQRLKRTRESELWGDLVDKVGEPDNGSQWIHVFDRAGDTFEAMCHIIEQRCDWAICVEVEPKSAEQQGRAPNLKATRGIPSMWLRAVKGMRPRLKLSQLTVREFFREVAKLGGFLGRTHDGEPGWQTIWRGYKKLHLIVLGLEIATA